MTVTAWLLIALTLFTILLVACAAYEVGAPPVTQPPTAEPWSSPPAPPEYLPAHRLETRLRWPGHHLER